MPFLIAIHTPMRGIHWTRVDAFYLMSRHHDIPFYFAGPYLHLSAVCCVLVEVVVQRFIPHNPPIITLWFSESRRLGCSADRLLPQGFRRIPIRGWWL